MKRIKDINQLNKFISKFHLDKFAEKDITKNMGLILFKKGEYICRDNQELEYLIFFVKGKAKIYRILENGKASLICFYEEFSIIGDLELITKNKTSMNVKVLEDSYCVVIPIDVAKEYINDPKFLLNISKSLGDKLYKISQNSSINVTYQLENRVASYILATEKYRLNENLTEIAELLGVSYRHLLRTLKALVDKGIIRKSKEGYEVIDTISMEELAGDLYK